MFSLSRTNSLFRLAAVRAALMLMIGTAAFVLGVLGLRLAAGILLFVIFNWLAAAVGRGVFAAHNFFLLSFVHCNLER